MPLSSRSHWLFAAFALAFAIKVPMFPVHTWLPDAHTEAPTAGSVILAGVMLKMGTYGFLRFAIPLFPDGALEAVPLIAALAVIGIIYGALVAMVQPDLKRLVAYSSVSHLGFVMLGIFALNPQGIEGAIYQMLNHGLSTGALFLLVGMIYERRHTREISRVRRACGSSVPMYAAIFMVVMLSSIGLPGLNGFVGEFLILLGAFSANHVARRGRRRRSHAGRALHAVGLRARDVRPDHQGRQRNDRDLTGREIAVMVPLVGADALYGALSAAAAQPDGAVGGRAARPHPRQRQATYRPPSTTRLIAALPQPARCGGRTMTVQPCRDSTSPGCQSCR